MNFFRLALELLGLYILYKLVFDLIIPVAKTTKQVKKQFSDMSAKMQDIQQQQQRQNAYSNTTTQTATKSKSDDYIDFEEVK